MKEGRKKRRKAVLSGCVSRKSQDGMMEKEEVGGAGSEVK